MKYQSTIQNMNKNKKMDENEQIESHRLITFQEFLQNLNEKPKLKAKFLPSNFPLSQVISPFFPLSKVNSLFLFISPIFLISLIFPARFFPRSNAKQTLQSANSNWTISSVSDKNCTRSCATTTKATTRNCFFKNRKTVSNSPAEWNQSPMLLIVK